MKRSSAVVVSRLRAPDTRRYDILFYVSYDVRVELCNVRARDIYSEKYDDVEGSGGGRNMRTAAACVTFLNAAATAFVEEPDSVSSLLDLRPKRRSGAYTWAPATGTVASPSGRRRRRRRTPTSTTLWRVWNAYYARRPPARPSPVLRPKSPTRTTQ